MNKKNGNIVMFPKWKANLEHNGLQAVKDKRFHDAVDALQPLVEYDVANDDVITGLLMSWIELGQYDDAENLCQVQMKHTMDETYYHYLHIYITILFQRNQYQNIIDLLDEVFVTETIPHQSRTQLWQMYEVSKKLLEDNKKEQGKHLLDQFFEALESNEVHIQWVTINQLSKQCSPPLLEPFVPVLKQKDVHPILKTAILEWFRDCGLDEQIIVHKFSQSFEVVPTQLSQFESDYIIQQIQLRMAHIEQSNPSMYEMLNKLLFHYFYVRYPLLPDEKDVSGIVEALTQIGHEYLQLPYAAKEIDGVEKIKQEIELCEQHYLVLVGES